MDGDSQEFVGVSQVTLRFEKVLKLTTPVFMAGHEFLRDGPSSAVSVSDGCRIDRYSFLIAIQAGVLL
jgi:hypothetical protein